MAIFFAGQIVTADDLEDAAEIGKMVADFTATTDSSTWNSSTKVLTNLATTFTARDAGKYLVTAKATIAMSAAAYATMGLVYKQGGAAVATDTLIDGSTSRADSAGAIWEIVSIGTFTATASGTYGVAAVGWMALGAATGNLDGDASHAINRLTVERVG